MPTLEKPMTIAPVPAESSANPQPTGNPGYISVRNYDFFYGASQALYGVNLEIPEKQITAFIGPSGCGKSTLLRNFNRMNDLIDGIRHQGDILINGRSIYERTLEVSSLRKRVGMVFQKSNPFPKSIFENVIYGLRMAGINDRRILEETCETALKGAALWEEAKDRLNESALGLSGGQMQRLCIARAIAIKPEVILMDEPCSALDPISTGKIEELILELRSDFTVVLVTHNMQQAARASDYTVFLNMAEDRAGYVVEQGETIGIFTNPQHQMTEDYVSGRFG